MHFCHNVTTMMRRWVGQAGAQAARMVSAAKRVRQSALEAARRGKRDREVRAPLVEVDVPTRPCAEPEIVGFALYETRDWERCDDHRAVEGDGHLTFVELYDGSVDHSVAQRERERVVREKRRREECAI